MSPYCDFEEQVTTRSEEKILKPDMVVRLPNERVIVVDSKAVFDAFLDASQTDIPDKKQEALIRHAKNLRLRVQDLSRKSYWEQFENSPDFCVLFIPNEALLAAAVEIDRDIIEDALKDKIIIATPTTLVALLKAVAFGWQQNQMTENAQKIIASAHELYERVVVWVDHFGKVGDRLQSAVKSYNDSVGSMESRVLPSVRRMQDLGLKPGKEVALLEPIDSLPRVVSDIVEPDAH
jgi:DNA recombination protein RmuC